MRMKKLKNILRMNRTFFCFKSYCSMLVCVLFLSANILKAENKNTDNESKIIVTGLVRDAHTKQPINAAQITVLDNSVSATTNEKGIFKLNVRSKNEIIVVSAFDYNVRQISSQSKDSIVIDLYSDVFTNYFDKVDVLTGSARSEERRVGKECRS